MDFDILILPGGFSYSDDAGAGRILANQLKLYLKELPGRLLRVVNLLLVISRIL